MSSVYIVEEHYIPYSVAKKLLSDVIKSGGSSNLLQRTYDYLNSVEKCDAESAQKVVEELSSIISREDVRAILASICPITPDEVRSILVMDSNRTYTSEDIQKIIDIIRKYIKS
ncbi:DNA-directed RNA polymerase subunit F [Sulfolobus sp. E5-1-F]|uniref:DNA-directed RNA polymerase subunit F n=1 Tax=Sulfolobaceae TaxID=118883 RepID=UPI001294B130|nr:MULTISPECIES: DNA-directed RNA polymerase subunit F [unclassified Sulfolobus]QGA54481.1 DNA-directed RNA polymerase subunit F [Sulfolobus sp. E5-1-F]QGA69517.1 DNA-directed RNA polymerase subunit F [Sulfolobus sp. E11-6]